MDSKILTYVGAGAVVLVAGAIYFSGFSLDGGEKKKGERKVTASISTFDPEGDVTLDLDAYGSERPDDYAVQDAFYGTFEGFDQCLVKERKRMGDEEMVLEGDATITIKLNPKKSKPLGVNAALPEEYSDDFKDCLREAAAKGKYPTYDGPPVVAEFEFEIDPGYEEE